MINKPFLKLLGLSSAALLLGTASVASAACDVQPEELRIVAFATSDATPIAPGHTGRSFLVVENRSANDLDLGDCFITSEYIDPTSLNEETTKNGLDVILPVNGYSPLEPGARVIISLFGGGGAAQAYYNDTFNVPNGYVVGADEVIYTPDTAIEMYAIKSGSNIYLSNDDGDVITSIAYGELAHGTAVGQSPRIEADDTIDGSGFFVVRNSHILENDDVYYDGTFWTELPIWWDLDADPLDGVPEGVLWPAPLQVPDLAEDICGDMAITGEEICDTQEGCTDTCVPYEHWECNDIEGDIICTPEPGWICDDVDDPADCHTVCGDGIVAGEEICDDQVGCSDTCTPHEHWECNDVEDEVVCTIEPGWICSDADETDCGTVCGDGILAGEELCDDGNKVSGDGCSATCAVEEDWTCMGTPSVCTEDIINPVSVCGNGVVEPGEACDDGNATNGDGCSNVCRVEEGWACKGEPSECKEVSGPAVCGDDIVQGNEECDGQVGCNDDCTWGAIVTGGRAGSCSTGLGEGAGGGLAMLALGLGLLANRRRKNAA